MWLASTKPYVATNRKDQHTFNEIFQPACDQMTFRAATTLGPQSACSAAPSTSLPSSSSDTLENAKKALVSLIDSGVSLGDARVETLLTLIRRFKASHSSPLSLSTLPTQPSAPLPSSPQKSNVHANPAPSVQGVTTNPSTSPANHYDGVPPVLLPLAQRYQNSETRSFLPHNQKTIVAGRLALEQCPAEFELTHVPAMTRRSSTPSSNEISAKSLPETPMLHAPPSVFKAARAIVQEARRNAGSKRKGGKEIGRSVQGRVGTPPKRRGSSASCVGTNSETPEYSFTNQRCGGLSAPHAFQVKSQAEMLRRVLRGLNVPTEIWVSAKGNPPTSVNPIPAPIIARGSSDPDMNSTPATDPSLFTQTPEPFDPRRLPRFSLGYHITEQDVLMPGEESVPSGELNERLLVAQTHLNRLRSHSQKNGVRHDESLRLSANVQLDSKVVQQHRALIEELRSTSHIPQNPSLLSLDDCGKPRSGSSLDSGQNTALQYSVMLDHAGVPISVASTPAQCPSFNTLQEDREKRISSRVQSRIQEISELLPTSSPDIRRTLIIEQKQLRLVPLQHKVRKSVMSSMHRTLLRPGVSDLSIDKVSKMRRELVLKSASARTAVESSVNGTLRNNSSYTLQQQSRRKARRSNMLQALTNHGTQFKTLAQQQSGLRKRLMKDLERYFRDRSREEERRRKKEQIDRLRALRNNNEDEYLELLKTTKNKRLIQLLRQTDEYLVQIGAQVERQKQAAREEDDNVPEQNGSAQIYDKTKANPDKENSQSDEDELNQLRKRRNDYYTITHTISEKVYQPKCLIGGKLKPYQLEGLEWLVSLYNNNLNGILADEMGLGKTIQTLSLITYLVEVKKVLGPFLVIVPLSVISNWTRELDRWAPSLVTVVYRGDPATRKGIQTHKMQGGNYHLLLTTYEFIVKDKNVLGRIRWKYIIMDEGHRMKNADCKLALTLGAKYTSRNRLLLTGTPLQNNMTELWALLNFLLPTIFSSAETFETWFNAPFQETALGDSAELNEEENLLIISRLHQVLRPFMLRRLKTDVEAQLPDKVEIVFRCNMSIWQRVLYRQMRKKLGIAGGAGNVAIRSFNNIMMQLKKVCNHPFLFYNEEELMSLPPDYLIRAAGKFELLNHVLRKLQSTGHRVLIFSQMTAALNYLEYFLSRIGMKHLRLDGMTKADDRQEMLELFNAPNSEYSCFLLSTRAGGLGLNLQTADTVIIFDSDWNPMMDLQAQDRAHRIGQTKEVRVFRLICSGSVEVKILERATRKLQIESQVIQAGQFNNKSSDNDRHEMLKDLLRQQADDDFARKDVTSLEEINRNLARGSEEFDLFQSIDVDLKKQSAGRPRLLESEEELPAWVLKPEQEMKQKEQLEAETMAELGRGRRKRKQVTYDDNLTEREWTLAMEEDGDIEEAIKKKKRRLTVTNDAFSEGSHEDYLRAAKSEAADRPLKEDVSLLELDVGDPPDDMEMGNGVRISTKEKRLSKLEPFIDPELNPAPRIPKKRGRPRKSISLT